jgi:hypothetical protein
MEENTHMETICEDQGELPSLEEMVAGMSAGDISPDQAAAMEKEMESVGMPFQATMGTWKHFDRLVDWLRSRRLVRKLPVQVVYLPWFACHVPQEGTAQVSITSSDTDEMSVGVKVFGSGFGHGRALSIKVISDTEPRKLCALYSVALRVLPMIYSQGNEESVVLEIEGEVGTRSETLDICPFCMKSLDILNPFDYELGEFIDLRRDKVKHKTKMNLEWNRNNSLELSLPVPAFQVPVTLSLNAKLSSSAAWEMAYEFAPGYLYQPFRKREMPEYQPPVWASTQEDSVP